MLQKTPPLGWNSWNTFASEIHETLIYETADTMVESGLRDAGYRYLVIDDCWSLKERDADGRLVADPAKFPHGMKAVADYVHSKGLLFGMYSCAGNLTCAGYPGSFEHEFVDAETFASWGVDFLKYDYCYHSNIIHGKYLYRRMGMALKNCGRDILLSACSWGADETAQWIRETGANMWRSTGDIVDSWSSIRSLTEQQDAILPYGGAGCFNDMDMLVVGMYGKGNVGVEGLNDIQYRTHFSLWALMASPLMIGCDIRQMNRETLEILTNREMLAINQDEDARQVMKLTALWGGDSMKCYARLLSNGDLAIGCFNFAAERGSARLNLDELGLPESTGKTLEMHEVWTGENVRVKNGTFIHDVEPYGCLVYRCRIVDR